MFDAYNFKEECGVFMTMGLVFMCLVMEENFEGNEEPE